MSTAMTNTALVDTNLSRSRQMLSPLLYEALSRERTRELEEHRRREYVRRLAVLKRRQRRADAARLAVQMLSVW